MFSAPQLFFYKQKVGITNIKGNLTVEERSLGLGWRVEGLVKSGGTSGGGMTFTE